MATGKIRHVTDLEKEYILEKKLGEGVYGEVYLASEVPKGTSKRHMTQVALKKITASWIREKDLIEEFDVMKNLSAPRNVGGAGCHIGIVCYHDLFYTLDEKDVGKTPVFWLVMQYLPGSDLHDVYKANKGKGMKTDDILKLMKHLLVVLDYIHSRGVAHLDIKPENVRMSDDVFYLIDFGFACMQPIKPCSPNGTPVYMDPCLHALRRGAADIKTYQGYMKADIWSLGIILVEMSTGHDVEDFMDDEFMDELYDKTVDAFVLGKTFPRISQKSFMEEYPEVDKKVVDLIFLMLTVDYKARPTATEILGLM